MIDINADTVFADGWDVLVEPKLSAAFCRAALDGFGAGYNFYNASGEVVPDEVFQEAIEAGIAELTRVLVEA